MLRIEDGGVELLLVRVSGVEERLPLVGDERDVAVLVNSAVVLSD